MDAGEISSRVFDTIRKASRVSGPSHGGLNWVFSAEDLVTLVRRAESGRCSERGTSAARAWRGLLLERGITVVDT